MHSITVFVKRSSLLFALLVVVLSVVSFRLYRSNKAYKQYNRSLVIQNDSILSANIQLSNDLEVRKTGVASRNKAGIKKNKER